MHPQPMAAPERTPNARPNRRRGRGHKPSPPTVATEPQPSLDERLERARDAIEQDVLVDWRGRPRAPATVSAYHEGCVPWNAGRRFPAEVLTPDEIQAVLRAFSPTGSAGIRNRAVVVLLWRAGLRIGEALALFPKDVDAALGTLTILEGKGAKRRVVGIDANALDYLDTWLRRRAKLGVDDSYPLFCAITRGSVGRPLTYSNFRDSLAVVAKRSGVSKRVHPHGFRHTHAFELAMEGVPVQIIQAQLGHESLEMTQHYIDHLAPVAVVRALQGRDWPTAIGLATPAPPAPAPVAALSDGAAPEIRTAAPSREQLTGDPREPELHPTHGTPANAEQKGGRWPEVGPGPQRVLDVLVANGGQASSPQIAEAVGVKASSIHRHTARLYALRLIVRGGTVPARKRGGARAVVWKLAPPAARFIPMPEDPRVAPVLHARSGQGAQRVLDVITKLGGGASQVQLAHELGLGCSTIARHCQTLETRGLVTRGALDKTTSNRGSQVWQLHAPEAKRVTWAAAGATDQRLTFTLGLSRTRLSEGARPAESPRQRGAQ